MYVHNLLYNIHNNDYSLNYMQEALELKGHKLLQPSTNFELRGTAVRITNEPYKVDKYEVEKCWLVEPNQDYDKVCTGINNGLHICEVFFYLLRYQSIKL